MDHRTSSKRQATMVPASVVRVVANDETVAVAPPVQPPPPQNESSTPVVTAAAVVAEPTRTVDHSYSRIEYYRTLSNLRRVIECDILRYCATSPYRADVGKLLQGDLRGVEDSYLIYKVNEFAAKTKDLRDMDEWFMATTITAKAAAP